MDLEFLLRRTPKWRIALQTILFTDGDIVESGERGGGGREPLGRRGARLLREAVWIRTQNLLHGKRVVGSVPATRETAALSGAVPHTARLRGGSRRAGRRSWASFLDAPPSAPPSSSRGGAHRRHGSGGSLVGSTDEPRRWSHSRLASERARSRARPRCRRATGAASRWTVPRIRWKTPSSVPSRIAASRAARVQIRNIRSSSTSSEKTERRSSRWPARRARC